MTICAAPFDSAQGASNLLHFQLPERSRRARTEYKTLKRRPNGRLFIYIAMHHVKVGGCASIILSIPPFITNQLIQR